MKKIGKRLIALLCAIVLLGTMIPAGITPVEAAGEQESSYPYKKVITSCDSKDEESNILATLVHPTDSTKSWPSGGNVNTTTKIEGAASLRSDKASGKSGTVANLFFAETVDVKGYEYFSCQLYVSDVASMTEDTKGYVLYIYLYSSDTPADTTARVAFGVKKEDLTSGTWNNIKLSFADAIGITENYDGGIDWLQFTLPVATTGTVTFYIDDICAVNAEEGLLFANCDQKSGKLVTITGVTGDATTTERKEGEAAWKSNAFLHTSSSSYRVQTQITLTDVNKLNINDFISDGHLQFWLYINKIDYMTQGLTIELGSGGAAGSNSVLFSYEKEKLQEEWNLIQIPLYSYYKSNGDISWEEVNYFRLLSIGVADAGTVDEQYMILDNIRVGDSIQVQVAHCDSEDELSASANGTTILSDDVKEGNGAFVHEDNSDQKVWHQLSLKNAVDFSPFRGQEGSLHFWLYIEDVSRMQTDFFVVELSSTGRSDTNDQDYRVYKENLTNGWNEIYICLDDDTNDDADKPTWNSIKCISIYSNEVFASACTTKIDDISLEPKAREKVDVRFVSTVESLGYEKVGFKIRQSRAESVLTTETTNVYRRLYAVGNDSIDSFSPYRVSGSEASEYMHTATILNIPNRLWDATFTITPYWVTQNGIEVCGTPKTYTINQMRNASNQPTTTTENTIDIYLIAGQSNAMGSSPIKKYDIDVMEELTDLNSSYTDGFSNVFYSGTANNLTKKVTNVVANIHNNGLMGPEVGMADSLTEYYDSINSDVGFIKYAIGGTALLDKNDDDRTKWGNWVSPTYEEYLKENEEARITMKTGEVTEPNDMTGALYDNLLKQVNISLKEYEAAGYTPVIRGMYWMQGEADRQYLTEYEEAFEYFATDIRCDLAKLTGVDDLYNMPIIIGEISETFSTPHENMMALNQKFIDLQNKLANEIPNCYISDNSQYHITDWVYDEEGEHVYYDETWAADNDKALYDGKTYQVYYYINDNDKRMFKIDDNCVDRAHWNYEDCLAIGKNVGNIIKTKILGVSE